MCSDGLSPRADARLQTVLAARSGALETEPAPTRWR